jgi:glycosyltransferase involved in cell wall biosynthesis
MADRHTSLQGTAMNDVSKESSHAGVGAGDTFGNDVALTVVICTYNRYDVFPDAIASLETQTLDSKAFEILVVDNSSNIEAQSAYWNNHDLPPNARLILDSVSGLSRARNTGLRESGSGIIAYMDDDAVALPGWCEALLSTFRTFDQAGIVGGPVEPIWPDTPPARLHKWHRGFFTIVDLGEECRPLQPREWLAGTNIAFRKAALERAGGFNEGLGRIQNSLMSNEELVASAKIVKLGYQSYYNPQARMMHRVHENRVSQRWLRRRVSWQAVSDLLANPSGLDPERCWTKLADYLPELPIEMRGVRGLFLDSPDSDTFYKQCQALEAFLLLALNDARDPESE